MPRSRPISWSLARTSLRVVSPKLRTFRSWSSVRLTRCADGGDALALQAVGGPDGELQLGQAHVELALELGVERHRRGGRRRRGPRSGRPGPGSLYWTNGLRCLRRILAASTRAISGPSDAGRPDLAGSACRSWSAGRRGCSRPGTRRGCTGLKLASIGMTPISRSSVCPSAAGAVAAAVLDGHLEDERHVVGQGAEDVVGVDDLDRLVVEDVGGRDHAAAVALDADRPAAARSGS